MSEPTVDMTPMIDPDAPEPETFGPGDWGFEPVLCTLEWAREVSGVSVGVLHYYDSEDRYVVIYVTPSRSTAVEVDGTMTRVWGVQELEGGLIVVDPEALGGQVVHFQKVDELEPPV